MVQGRIQAGLGILMKILLTSDGDWPPRLILDGSDGLVG